MSVHPFAAGPRSGRTATLDTAPPTRRAVAATDVALREIDPSLHQRWRDALPRAADTVARRLLAAARRERLAGVHTVGDHLVLPGGATVRAVRHGFDRAEPAGPLPRPAPDLIAVLAERLGGTLADELDSAVANLALGYARRPAQLNPFTLATGPDERAAAFERLATRGHNLHPCGRTRLGWTPADVLAYDLEADGIAVVFLGVRRDRHVGDDVGELLGRPGDTGRVVQPMHPWQAEHLRRTRPELFADGSLTEVDTPPLPATATAAVRTLYVAGFGYLKLSLDVQITSTRRTVSVASTRNGPVLSRLLTDLLDGERVLLLREPAGGTVVGLDADRDLAAISRVALAGRLDRDEVAVPAGALTAALPDDRSVVCALLARSDRPAEAFVAEYAALVLPPLLRLATRYGVGLEAHLQNCLPTFGPDGHPRRLVLRDLAGLRVHLPRISARGLAPRLWPGSVVVTDDVDVMRAKLGYTLFQAHLGELIRHLVMVAGLDEPAAWRAVRRVVDEVYDGLRADPAVSAWAAADHAFWTAPTMPHKALVRMRLAGAGDEYLPVANPLR